MGLIKAKRDNAPTVWREPDLIIDVMRERGNHARSVERHGRRQVPD